MADEDDLSRVVGRIEGLLGAVQQNIASDARSASEGRKALHAKMDRVTDTMQSIDKKIEINSFQLTVTSEIAIQAREGVKALQAKLDKEVDPVVRGISTFRKELGPLIRASRTIRNYGILFGAIFGSGVISLAALFTFFNDAARAAFKAWLGI